MSHNRCHFFSHDWREKARTLLRKYGYEPIVCYVDAKQECIEQRLAERKPDDVMQFSRGTIDNYLEAKHKMEIPTTDEHTYCLDNNWDITSLQKQLDEFAKWLNNKKKPTVLLIHWWWNNPWDWSCLDAIAEEYTSLWYRVIYPQLSYANDYDFEKALRDLQNYNADIVIWHSSGWFLALHYSSEKKPKKMILISPTCESYCDEARKTNDNYVLTGTRSRIFSDSFVSGIEQWLGKEWCDKYISFHDHNVDFTRLKDQSTKVIFERMIF